MARDLSKWSYLWDLEAGEYVLWRTARDAGLEGCIIFNNVNKSILMIEDNELASELKVRMHEVGVPIIDGPPPGKSPISQVIEEMFASGKSIKEINSKIKEMRRQQGGRESGHA